MNHPISLQNNIYTISNVTQDYTLSESPSTTQTSSNSVTSTITPLPSISLSPTASNTTTPSPSTISEPTSEINLPYNGDEILEFNTEDYEFNWNIFPFGFAEPRQILIHKPHTLTIDDWLILLRIQKCGTKTLTTLIKKNTRPLLSIQSCESAFYVTGVFEYSQCRRYTKCNLNSFKRSKRSTCVTLTDQHCDWMDIFDTWNIDDSSVHTVSILRNPIRRVLSEYKHVYDNRLAVWDYCIYNNDAPKYSRENFLNFINDVRHSPGMKNRQTRMIAGCGSGTSCSSIYLTEQDMLEVAKANLLKCSEIGVLGEFKNFVQRLEYVFNWDIQEYNIVTESTDEIELDWIVDEETEKAILELNYLDLELYEFALELSKFRTNQLKTLKNLGHFECNGDLCSKQYQ